MSDPYSAVKELPARNYSRFVSPCSTISSRQADIFVAGITGKVRLEEILLGGINNATGDGMGIIRSADLEDDEASEAGDGTRDENNVDDEDMGYEEDDEGGMMGWLWNKWFGTGDETSKRIYPE